MIASTHARRLVAMLGATALAATALFLAPACWAAAGPPTADHDLGSQIARYEGIAADRSGPPPAGPNLISGLDVSGHQGNVDWPAVAGRGAKFAYVKATESTDFRNPFFTQQYNGSYQVGLIRGAYHFARPDRSDGVAQANFFVDHGGGWSRDGRTLPPALDIEYNPRGDACYGLAPRDMVNWVRAFSERVKSRVGRYPVIYTSTRWWNQCTGRDGSLGGLNPLWVPRYAPAVGELPAGWRTNHIWQFSNVGPLPGDQDYFLGTIGQLRGFARG